MIDAHCHLQRFEREEISSAQNDVKIMLCNSDGIADSLRTLELVNKFVNVYAAVGLGYEPKYKKWAELKNELVEMCKNKKVVAIGECGLDEVNDEAKELFQFHIDLAKELDLPLVVHSRRTYGAVLDMLDYERAQMHCFTGSLVEMEECVKRGWYISFGGILTFKKSDTLREIARVVPESRLLTETDSPYLAPEPIRGSRNIPGNVKYVVECLARVRSTTTTEINRIVEDNCRKLFRI